MVNKARATHHFLRLPHVRLIAASWSLCSVPAHGNTRSHDSHESPCCRACWHKHHGHLTGHPMERACPDVIALPALALLSAVHSKLPQPNVVEPPTVSGHMRLFKHVNPFPIPPRDLGDRRVPGDLLLLPGEQRLPECGPPHRKADEPPYSGFI